MQQRDGLRREETEAVRAVRLLHGAALVVRERGIAQFSYQDRDGRVCMYAALSIAAGGGPNDAHVDTEYNGLACRAIRSVLPSDATIAGWNAADGRTPDEVARVFEMAAGRLEGGFR